MDWGMGMARLNIEDTLWKDFRFQELMVKVGSRHAAKGMVLELWMLAQEYWFPEKKYIPAEKIAEAGLQPVVDSGLAVLKPEGGYFAIGSEKAFDWLFAAREKGKKGGEKSAEKRRNGGLSLTPAEAQVDPGQAQVKPSEPSLLFTLGSKKEEYMGSSDDDPTSAFEEIYKNYPKRQGSHRKKDALKSCLKNFKTLEQIESLSKAVKNYAKACASDKTTGTKFVLQFATFVNGVWEEWLEDSHKTHTNAPKVVVRTMEDLR